MGANYHAQGRYDGDVSSLMPVLVTGAQGFLGRYVVQALLSRGEEVVGVGRSAKCTDTFTHRVDDDPGAGLAPLPPDLLETNHADYRRLDLTDAWAVADMIASLRPGRIIHLAGALRDEPWSKLQSSNVIATASLCQAIRQMPLSPAVLICSSGSIYGEQVDMPVRTTALPKPVGGYAASKLMAELAAQAILREARIDVAVARIFNLIGPGLQPRHLAAHVAQQIATMEARETPGRIVLGDLNTVRDFIDVRDAADMLVNWPPQAPDETLNIASGEAVSMKVLVDAFLAAARIDIEIAHDPDRSRPGADIVVAHVEKRHWPRFSGIALQQSVRDMLQYARDCGPR